MPHVQPQITHRMIGDLPIWTVTVNESQITQTRDYTDVCAVIGHAVVDGAKRITVKDGNDLFIDLELDVREVQA